MMSLSPNRPVKPARYGAHMLAASAKRAPRSGRPGCGDIARRPVGRPVIAKKPYAPARRVEAPAPRIVEQPTMSASASNGLTIAGGFVMTVFATLLMFCRGGLGPNGYLSYATIALGMAAWLLRDASWGRKAFSAR
jgi:hypothetical protein